MITSLTGERVRIGAHALQGELLVPRDASALVLFVHGGGSGRLDPRNQFVASVLHAHHQATLLIDLLGEAESCDAGKGVDIEALSERVESAMAWLAQRDDLAALPLGLFGASTGAAAALEAAAHSPGRVSAVVSRGGRIDLSGHLSRVMAPTLLIIGGDDKTVLALNMAALARLTCTKRLEMVPGASHSFEEPGALESVAHLAGAWFERHAPAGRRP